MAQNKKKKDKRSKHRERTLRKIHAECKCNIQYFFTCEKQNTVYCTWIFNAYLRLLYLVITTNTHVPYLNSIKSLCFCWLVLRRKTGLIHGLNNLISEQSYLKVLHHFKLMQYHRTQKPMIKKNSGSPPTQKARRAGKDTEHHNILKPPRRH